jgi:catechol 2,3-dioxygenase-like lactoylglutathione lyase family enzyme
MSSAIFSFFSGSALYTHALTEVLMLASGKMVGFIPTKDYNAARAFYEGKLQFAFVSQDQFALVVCVGEHSLRIVKLPNYTPLQATILGWDVQNITAVVQWLASRGVATEKYAWLPDKDKETGIWVAPGGDKVAWFKDPDGNVLSVSEHSARK